jgi:transcriptional regulator NrdR family protein
MIIRMSLTIVAAAVPSAELAADAKAVRRALSCASCESKRFSSFATLSVACSTPLYNQTDIHNMIPEKN